MKNYGTSQHGQCMELTTVEPLSLVVLNYSNLLNIFWQLLPMVKRLLTCRKRGHSQADSNPYGGHSMYLCLKIKFKIILITFRLSFVLYS